MIIHNQLKLWVYFIKPFNRQTNNNKIWETTQNQMDDIYNLLFACITKPSSHKKYIAIYLFYLNKP